jgi:hemoglobin
MTQDIESRKDIELLVNTFYNKVKTNKVLGPIFYDVAKVDWEVHLPKMYSFWAGLLLGDPGFEGNLMQKHINLSRLTTMTKTEFSEWILLFTQTTDELFKGPKAEEAKERAASIARLMVHKIQASRAN